ncbi:leydig cell tumor [Micractinium conductrix]|uniref:Leydig cell tumor n=1 Tax=Micractinium conductrix TaxID=554055 RepID=A0A2P6VI05_9CHLO|nr:leydig cell tumor [Micractinium conductrix]|eukprot:PSC73708.1 leydig cell tumor [Micractinium conductrix]
MAQKLLAKGKKVKAAGKQSSVKRSSEKAQKTKKGALNKPPKRSMLKAAHKEALELTKAINWDNEEHFTATAASQPGGKLSVLKAPVATSADQKLRIKKSLKPGTAFGMARQKQ